eukprot:gnl/TRDRNA2_/TRDRNA2_41621_c0_seq1.p1 gnl/TRDRNA2_/TRDRNA2_41621_c0~~gnl/TRDRNA2_/TRDRNA2_41621_c0_seq1.p1  ORF type:complete len:374 (-),score=49.47 gnl/TRDRNA2_/TRDRNA2_41621_c0_seq1:59-1105(-)
MASHRSNGTHARDAAAAWASSSQAAEVRAAAAAVEAKHLAELRSFRQPPAAVIQVLEAIAVLLGLPETGWLALRKRLDATFLQRLGSFDASAAMRIPIPRVDRLQQLLHAPGFGQALREKCPSAAPLAAWCQAVGRLLSCIYRQGGSPSPVTCVSSARTAAVDEPVEQQQPQISHRSEHASHDNGPQLGEAVRKPPLMAPYPQAAQPGPPCDLGGLSVMPELWRLNSTELMRVPDLCVTRGTIGSVTWHGETDCRGLLSALKDVVVIDQGEVVVYPSPGQKPPVGQGLNKPASVVLLGCMPKSSTRLTDPRARERYVQRVKQMTAEKGAIFEDYDCDSGTWKFRVEHF